ncbi:MAG: cysteine--tRNA ligase, partial [Firmicutes bacterium]|nr:cysteine--tRNA ligase [Bacillota bacterium]
DGDVYFRVENVKEYGKLSNRNIDDLISGSRVDINEKKENPLDFTLWKKTEIGINFDSPWGFGRPGWHTECVAMIDDIFGQQIDIHGGGSGLMFPHHENEIAQSLVLNHHHLAKYWMHNGLLNISGNKMSKSEGEIVLVKDLIIDPNAFRLFTLSTHYRSPINYTDEVLVSYEKEWDKLKRTYSSLYLKLDLEDALYENAIIDPDLLLIYKDFLSAMDNDFSTPNVITALQDLVKISNQMLRNKTENGVILSVIRLFDDIFSVLGLKIDISPLGSSDKETYHLWNKARDEKDFEKADIYRNILQEKGII